MPEVAARAHLRWIVPVLDAAWADAGVAWRDVDAIAVTYGPGLAGSLLVGINFAKALAHVHRRPLVGVNHLEGHVYAGWLLDPGDEERPAPEFPLVALVVSGGHTFLVEMRDELTYRLLGQTVDDAAGEAFDKVGRLLGLGYPGGPAIQRAAEGATRRDVFRGHGWNSYDFFSGLDGCPADRCRRASDEPPTTPGPALRGDGGARPRLQEAVVDVLSRNAPGVRGRPGRSWSVAGWPPTASCGHGSRASGGGGIVVVPRPGCARTAGR